MKDVSFTVSEALTLPAGGWSLWLSSSHLRHHLEKKLMLLVILHPCIFVKIIGQEPCLRIEAIKE